MTSRPKLAEQIADVLAKRRTELVALREGRARDEADDALGASRTDLLEKIRTFFALDDEVPPAR
jgi:hypothetical protein